MNMSVKAFLCLLTFSHSLSRISTMLILEILNVLLMPDSISYALTSVSSPRNMNGSTSLSLTVRLFDEA